MKSLKWVALVLILFFLFTCTSKNYISSPFKDSKLVFEWNNSLLNGKRGYIKVYKPDMKKNYYSIRPIMDLPIHIYWGDTIKIRGGLFVDSNIVTPGIIDWKNDYTELDQIQLALKDTNWRHYFISEIGEGKYER